MKFLIILPILFYCSVKNTFAQQLATPLSTNNYVEKAEKAGEVLNKDLLLSQAQTDSAIKIFQEYFLHISQLKYDTLDQTKNISFRNQYQALRDTKLFGILTQVQFQQYQQNKKNLQQLKIQKADSLIRKHFD